MSPGVDVLKRLVFMGVVTTMLGGCSLFESTCGRVANVICTIPGESASCRGLREMKSENHLAQNTCESIEPIARAYAAEPDSLVWKARWTAARIGLSAAGLAGEAFSQTPKEKLQDAADKAGEAATKAGEAAGQAGAAISEAAKNAGAIIREVVQDAKDDVKKDDVKKDDAKKDDAKKDDAKK
jgi:hypothetical protein